MDLFNIRKWLDYLSKLLSQRSKNMPNTIEELIDAAVQTRDARDACKIEVAQAVEAASDEIAKQTAVDGDVGTVDAALAAVQDAAANFKLGDNIEPLKALFQKLFEAEGVRLVDVDALTVAVTKSIKESSEAVTAKADYDAKTAMLVSMANDYRAET